MLLSVLVMLVCTPSAYAEKQRRPHAHAIVVGSNRAGPGQKPLRYAHTDARRILDVLTHIGGFERGKIQLVLDPGKQQLDAAFSTAQARLAAHSRRGEDSIFLFFYSGHARARALNLGPQEVNLATLRQRLVELPSTVTVAILDACQTGAISRVKGTTPAADFSYNSVNQLNTTGMAVLASSSASELSQEADTLRSSYFTHNLVVGLRGAADADSDGGITLSEAYRYAYKRTLVATAGTAVGKQHVTLETKLRGKGEMVLTFPGRASSTLELPAPLSAQVLVSRQQGQTVMAELTKAPGKKVALALPHGRYVATVRRAGGRGTLRCELTLPVARRLALNLLARSCTPVKQAQVALKGSARPEHPRWALELGAGILLSGSGAYVQRLKDFGFEEDNGLFGNKIPSISVALSHRFTPYLSAVLGWSSLDAYTAKREMWDLDQNSHLQKFNWWAHGMSLSLRGTLPLAGGVFNPYAQVGVGFAWATTELTDPLAASETVDDETQFGFLLSAAVGANVMPWRHFGFYGQVNYSYAPAINNLVDDTHDSGGPAFYLGVRGAL